MFDNIFEYRKQNIIFDLRTRIFTECSTIVTELGIENCGRLRYYRKSLD